MLPICTFCGFMMAICVCLCSVHTVHSAHHPIYACMAHSLEVYSSDIASVKSLKTAILLGAQTKSLPLREFTKATKLWAFWICCVYTGWHTVLKMLQQYFHKQINDFNNWEYRLEIRHLFIGKTSSWNKDFCQAMHYIVHWATATTCTQYCFSIIYCSTN